LHVFTFSSLDSPVIASIPSIFEMPSPEVVTTIEILGNLFMLSLLNYDINQIRYLDVLISSINVISGRIPILAGNPNHPKPLFT